MKKRKISKKAQIKIFESIAVLIIFIFLVSIGVGMYSNYQNNALKNSLQSFSRLDAVKTSIQLSNMPEISCSFEGITDISCTDLYKVAAWQELSRIDIAFVDFYYGQLGQSLIEIEVIYPNSINYTVYDNSLQKANSDSLVVPTILHDPSEKTNQLALLSVRTYYGTN